MAPRSGLKLLVDDSSFRQRQNKRGKPTVEGRVGYIGPLGMPTPPKVKLDLTADEVLVREPELRPVFRPFSDTPTTAIGNQLGDAVCYSLPEVLGEKIRALAERCRPRDLYDVVHTHRHPDLIGRVADVAEVLAAKCFHAAIPTPTLDPSDAVPGRDRERVVEHARASTPVPAELRRLLVATRRRFLVA